MTNADKYDELIAREPTLEGKARLIRAKALMSPCVASREYEPSYGEFEKPKLEELE